MIGAEVFLWGTRIGTVVQSDFKSIPRFQYDSDFLNSNIQLSPIMMPLSAQVYSFSQLNEETFHGLPGMLADSLPDKFGTRIVDDYLSKQGRSIENLTAVERLCYVGKRGMGALEYVPQKGLEAPDCTIDIDELAKLADKILSDRQSVRINADEEAMEQLIKVGTSAGGARAKALIAWNEDTNDIRSGQIEAGEGYSYWLLKFGNVENNRDKDRENDGKGYTQIEYAYFLMSRAAGIDMEDCRLIKTNGGVHFATKRFDREADTGRKIHMQSLGGIAHFDFNNPGAHSYEQAAGIMRKLGLPQSDVEQLYRRMVFNEVAKNYDDHVKNISFLMNREGSWKLSPAYDMTFSYNPNSLWTSRHQMKINGKQDEIETDDIIACGRSMDISDKKLKEIMSQVMYAVEKWDEYAHDAGIKENIMLEIKRHHKCNPTHL